MKDDGYSVCSLFDCSHGKGFTVGQFVEALCYKPESCGFDFQWGH